MALWDDLKGMEHDIDEWAATSIADLTDGVTNVGDKLATEARLATFQVRFLSGRACDVTDEMKGIDGVQSYSELIRFSVID